MAATLARPVPGDLQVLAAWAPELAETFVALSCDIALVIDEHGRILRLVQHDSSPIAPPSWVGAAWADTASADTRGKIGLMLDEVTASGYARRREISHPEAIGGGAPVAYAAVRLGANGPTLAVGQDLRPQAALQQRFLAAQEALERSYWSAQRRQAERPEAPVLMTGGERRSLGLGLRGQPAGDAASPDLADSELLRALGRLLERIGRDELPGLLRDARSLAERHFLTRAVQRAGSVEALALALGVSKRSLLRRGSSAGRRRKR